MKIEKHLCSRFLHNLSYTLSIDQTSHQINSFVACSAILQMIRKVFWKISHDTQNYV